MGDSAGVDAESGADTPINLPDVTTDVAAAAGRSGTGLKLGELPAMKAPVGRAMTGRIRTVIANIPNRTGSAAFARSMRTMTVDRPDFITLNEVGGRTISALRSPVRGYAAYRDPVPDRTVGGVQSMNNVVMWRTNKWSLLDGGRVKLVDNDRGYIHGNRFVWDRYATWAVLKRDDGAIASVVSAHMPTNPKKYPRQWGGVKLTRIQKYSRGMDIMVRLVNLLATRGPVFIGGDMNSTAPEGSWTAGSKMLKARHEWVKDRGVMFLFFRRPVVEQETKAMTVASDHPATQVKLGLRSIAPTSAP